MWPWLTPVLELIGKIIPDPQAAAAAKLQAMTLAQSGELAQLDAQLKLALGQQQIDAVEAASASAFRGNWRPFVGWICGAGIGYCFLLQPLLAWGSNIWHVPVPPTLDPSTLLTLFGTLTGVAGMRTFERVTGAIVKST
jgi:hypothetical protein